MLRFLIEKEFKQIFRHPFIPKLIFIFPVMMLLIMPWAANLDIENMNLCVIDNDHSSLSNRLVRKVTASGYFRLTGIAQSNAEAIESVDACRSDAILEIGNGFERDLYRTGVANVMISVNAVNGTKGGIGSQYLASIVRDFADDVAAETGARYASPAVVPQFVFNTRLDYKIFMVPALIVMLLTLLTGFLPALNIVNEKEAGTIEQINVTPVHKFTFIIAKLIPYWIIGYIVLCIVMTLAALVYKLTPAGSLATLFLYATIYVLVVSGLGLVVSNYSNTLQEAMFLIFFFTMIFILMSGLLTPVASMPGWAQAITCFNPLRYFMEVMRAIYLKGSGMANLLPQFFTLCGFAIVFIGWAAWSYKKSA
ncbi:MAG: ABC transporter permease [Bacteroidales bacterium]